MAEGKDAGTTLFGFPLVRGDVSGPELEFGHSPLCECPDCLLKRRIELGSPENPIVLVPPEGKPS